MAIAAAEEETHHLLEAEPAPPPSPSPPSPPLREETKGTRKVVAAEDDRRAPRLLALDPVVPWILPPPKDERATCPPPRRACPRSDGPKQDPFRSALPGRSERSALNRKLIMDCLHFYNSLHPDDEYEPAPGQLTRYSCFDRGFCWTHGNFVARRKRSGCFSFLPAPRTIFFFEFVSREDFDGVVTCIPLDEPVTEAYNFLGMSLRWRTRRDGRGDKICKTCYRRCEDHPGPRKPFACGHNHQAEIVCEMCYRRSCVLHPYPGEFAFGYKSRTSTHS